MDFDRWCKITSADFFAGDHEQDISFRMKFLLEKLLSPRIPAITRSKMEEWMQDKMVLLK